MQGSFFSCYINSDKLILSSQSLFYKTENFIKQTKYVSNINILLSKLCETIIFNLKQIVINEKEIKDLSSSFTIQTEDNQFMFSFKLGYQIGEDLNKYDIVFFDYLSNGNINTKNTEEYLKSNSKVIIKKNKCLINDKEFNKLYMILNNSGINLPKLSEVQKEIVETVDKNVLVQGVAGSGKTNICIDKIIFTACKNYSGKILYTTFSRGLLADTKLKVELYKKDLIEVHQSFKNNNIIFLDNNHKKALENKLGIYFFSDDEDEIIKKIEKVIDFLSYKVDYFLIEDIYKNKFGGEHVFVDEQYFIKNYCKNLSNYQIEKAFGKLSRFSKEIIYKEIYGMIYGFYNLQEKPEIISLDEYINARKDSFSRPDCESIYQIALDYKKHCEKNNLLDNNYASKEIIKNITDFEYSLAIIDEVQDYTQVNLCLFKKLSLKVFCVGDALQMINPTYFNFGYLKNLLYEKDIIDIKKLKYNYRNTVQISHILDELGEVNKSLFGTHNFLLKGKSFDSGIKTTAVFVKDNDFVKRISNSNFDNFTFVVGNIEDKKNLQKIIKNQEVLTVSEIKGLERDTIVTVNLLSSNIDKWNQLQVHKVNHKQADENSVFRYYYNLFYVGLSRAKQNIFVVEESNISQFSNFFKNNFENKDSQNAIKALSSIISKVEFTQDEIIDRINEFLKLGQYDNARFTANKIKKDDIRIKYSKIIEVTETMIAYGRHREAGIKFWEYGLLEEAKKQFLISQDDMLIELMDSVSANNQSTLSIDIIKYYEDVRDNEYARNFIFEILKNDIAKLKSSFSIIKENFKKGDKNGK